MLFKPIYRRLMSSTVRRIIVTDPSFAKNADEYKEIITDGPAGRPDTRQPGNYVPVLVSETFFSELSKRKNHEAFSKTNFESFWSLGRPLQTDFSKLHYLGSHGSDSGLTCIVDEDPFTKEPPAEPVDWPEFILSTLDTAEGDPDALEEYALYRFFGPIPDEGSEAAVFGIPSAEMANAYDGVIIRSLESLSSEVKSEDGSNGKDE